MKEGIDKARAALASGGEALLISTSRNSWRP
jgi:hypothetical protein